MSKPWRVGRRVPVNVYVGDTIAGQFQTETWARVAVEAVNARADLERQLADARASLKRISRMVDPEKTREAALLALAPRGGASTVASEP